MQVDTKIKQNDTIYVQIEGLAEKRVSKVFLLMAGKIQRKDMVVLSKESARVSHNSYNNGYTKTEQQALGACSKPPRAQF